MFEPYLEDIAQQTLAITKKHNFIEHLAGNAKPEPGWERVDPNSIYTYIENDSPLPVSEVESDIFPCLLAMCGSGQAFYMVRMINEVYAINKYIYFTFNKRYLYMVYGIVLTFNYTVVYLKQSMTDLIIAYTFIYA